MTGIVAACTEAMLEEKPQRLAADCAHVALLDEGISTREWKGFCL